MAPIDLPDPNGTIIAPGNSRASIRRKCYAPHPLSVTLKCPHTGTSPQVPKAHLAVVSSADGHGQSWTYRNSPDQAGVSGHDERASTCCQIPDSHRCVSAAAHQEAAVPGKPDGPDRSIMATKDA